jgi:hypothetical protein
VRALMWGRFTLARTRIKLNEFVIWIAPLKVFVLSRTSICCDCYAERAASASWPSIQHVANPARGGERHTLRHRSERHAVGLDRDMVFRFQALVREYRSISTIAHWKPVAPRNATRIWPLQPLTSVIGRLWPSDSSSCQRPSLSSYEMPVVFPGTRCSAAACSAALRAASWLGKVSETTPSTR